MAILSLTRRRSDWKLLDFTHQIFAGWIASMILATTFGIGVAFSASSILAYQGFFTFFASFVSSYLTANTISEINAMGGSMCNWLIFQHYR